MYHNKTTDTNTDFWTRTCMYDIAYVVATLKAQANGYFYHTIIVYVLIQRVASIH